MNPLTVLQKNQKNKQMDLHIQFFHSNKGVQNSLVSHLQIIYAPISNSVVVH